MRNTTRRAFVLYFVIVAFFCGLGFMMYNFFVHGSEWTSNLVNQHICLLYTSDAADEILGV